MKKINRLTSFLFIYSSLEHGTPGASCPFLTRPELLPAGQLLGRALGTPFRAGDCQRPGLLGLEWTAPALSLAQVGAFSW